MFAKTVGSRIAVIFDRFHIAFKIIRIALQILRLYGFASVGELLRNARFGNKSPRKDGKGSGSIRIFLVILVFFVDSMAYLR